MRQRHPDPIATLGASVNLLLAVQIAVGAILAFQYRAGEKTAHADTAAIAKHAGSGFLHGVHYWGSALLILLSGFLVLAATWSGAYRGQTRSRYLCALAIFAVTIGFQLTGNLLPFDRHGVQTAAIEGSIIARIPGIGPTLASATLAGNAFGPATLELWWNAHRFLFPVLWIITGIVAALAYMRHEDVEIDLRLAAIPTVVCALVAAFVAAPLGSAATPDDYSRFDAAPSWYTLPAHGLLVVFDQIAPGLGWVGAMLLPLIAGAVLLGLAATEADVRAARTTVIILALAFGLPTLHVIGRSAPLVGTRDPVSDPTRVTPPGTVDATVQPPQDATLAAKGRTAFNAGPCAGCHGQDGIGTPAGPSLTRSHVRHPEAEYYVRYIVNPKSVKATSTMPAFPDTKKEELDAIAEFLRFPIAPKPDAPKPD